jgi:hypothetical protein
MVIEFDLVSDARINYKLTFADFTGPDMMKARDKEPVFFGYGKTPPTALQHGNINTEDATRDAICNSIKSADCIPHKVEPRKNAAGEIGTDWQVEWKVGNAKPRWDMRQNFHKIMKATLPSGDDFTVEFSTGFCKEFDLHKFCGRPNEPCGYSVRLSENIVLKLSKY